MGQQMSRQVGGCSMQVKLHRHLLPHKPRLAAVCCAVHLLAPIIKPSIVQSASHVRTHQLQASFSTLSCIGQTPHATARHRENVACRKHLALLLMMTSCSQPSTRVTATQSPCINEAMLSCQRLLRHTRRGGLLHNPLVGKNNRYSYHHTSGQTYDMQFRVP